MTMRVTGHRLPPLLPEMEEDSSLKSVTLCVADTSGLSKGSPVVKPAQRLREGCQASPPRLLAPPECLSPQGASLPALNPSPHLPGRGPCHASMSLLPPQVGGQLWHPEVTPSTTLIWQNSPLSPSSNNC